MHIKDLSILSIEPINSTANKVFDNILISSNASIASVASFPTDTRSLLPRSGFAVVRNSGLYADDVILPDNIYPSRGAVDVLTDKFNFSLIGQGLKTLGVVDTRLVCKHDDFERISPLLGDGSDWIAKPRLVRGKTRRENRGWFVDNPIDNSQEVCRYLSTIGQVVCQPRVSTVEKYYAVCNGADVVVGRTDESDKKIFRVDNVDVNKIAQEIAILFGVFWFGFDIAKYEITGKLLLLDVNATTGGRVADRNLTQSFSQLMTDIISHDLLSS